ncbi:MAG: Molybdopterin molybdenumtransferase [Candidatus Omnitrophica bacterium]|nr:Molybdopterin molybdenumtransferase [Candidatus Omnitrophota bacterium]
MSAYAIMTGAAVPEGADAVIEKEKVIVRDGRVRVMCPVTRGRNIRRRAEELRRGSKLGVRGAVITPGLVGFLACVGLQRVPVHAQPRVGLIVTGDELADPGLGPLPSGRIYDSNTPMLIAALRSSGILDPNVSSVKDDPERLDQEVRRALRCCDVVVLTGGVSVGDHDPVKRVLKSCGVKCDFWRVKQKPGKPVYFGWKGRKLVFGLPGNPASAHACYYQYVYPCLRKLMGHRRTGLAEQKLPLEHALRPDPDKTLILRACLIRRSARSWCRVLRKQGSHMLSSMRRMEGFVVIDPGQKPLRAGSPVVFQRLTEGDG